MDWGSAAAAAGGNLLSSTITSVINNEYAKKREAEAREENYQYNEKAAENADQRTRALYNDLYSPQAQLQQIEKAGLSPSIYASGGLAGKNGSAGAQGSGVNGISPNVFGISPLDVAQISLAQAQAHKAEAEAKNVEGETPLSKAQIADYLASAGLKETQGKFVKAQTEGQELQNYVTNSTKNFSIQQAKYMAEKAYHESMQAYWTAVNEQTNAEFNIANFDNALEQAAAETQNILTDTAVKQSQYEVNYAEAQRLSQLTWAIAEEVAQGWKKLQIEGATQEASQKYMEDTIKTKFAELAQNKELTQAQQKIMKTQMWLDFGGNIIGNAIGIAGVGGKIKAAKIGAEAMTKAAKTTAEAANYRSDMNRLNGNRRK